jgi:hypothetical protein
MRDSSPSTYVRLQHHATRLTTRLKYEGCGGCLVAAVASAVLERRGGKASRHLIYVQPVGLDCMLAPPLYQPKRSQQNLIRYKVSELISLSEVNNLSRTNSGSRSPLVDHVPRVILLGPKSRGQSLIYLKRDRVVLPSVILCVLLVIGVNDYSLVAVWPASVEAPLKRRRACSLCATSVHQRSVHRHRKALDDLS